MSKPVMLVTCSICKAREGKEVIMDYNKKNDFYKCPVCHTETWIDHERIRTFFTQKKTDELIQQLNEQVRWAVGGRFTEVKSLVPEGNRKKGSGSKSGRKRKKKPARRKYELFYDT